MGKRNLDAGTLWNLCELLKIFHEENFRKSSGKQTGSCYGFLLKYCPFLIDNKDPSFIT